ncbi:MAG TPA: EpsG family protein [Candidatus Alistipes excrementavium]|nr:EpsG family protein [Candidatus Alistipes excrementavium]
MRQQSVAWFVLAAMLLLCGLRGDTVGTDTFNYLSPFSSSKQIGRTSELLFYLTYRLVPFPHLWLFLTACLIYVPLFGIVKKETYYAAVAVLIYMISVTKFFPESFNIIRQSIAASFILACFVDWAAERKKRSLLFLLIAVLFHNSSVIALPFLWLKNIRFRPAVVWTGVIATFLIGLSQMFNEVIGLFILGMDAVAGDGSAIGDTLSTYAAYGSNGTTFNTNFIIGNTLPLSMMCLLTTPTSRTDRSDVFYFNIMFVTTLIANIMIAATQYGFRLVFSLYIVQILVVANAYCYKNRIGRQLLTLFIGMLGLFYVYYLYGLSRGIAGDLDTIIPYRFFFQ